MSIQTSDNPINLKHNLNPSHLRVSLLQIVCHTLQLQAMKPVPLAASEHLQSAKKGCLIQDKG